MAKIYLMGHRNPVTVSLALARQVAEFKSDANVLNNEVFRSKDFVVEKGQIKTVIVEDVDDNNSESNSKKRQENDEHYAKVSKQYDDMIKTRCSMPIEKKAGDTRLMELVYKAFKGKDADQNFKDEVVKRQLAYFKKNPRHPYASISLGDLISFEKTKEDSITEIMPKLMLKKAFDVMSEALDTAKRIHAL